MPYQVAAFQVGDDGAGTLCANLILVLAQEDLPRRHKEIVEALKKKQMFLLSRDDLLFKSFEVNEGQFTINQAPVDGAQPPPSISLPAILIKFPYLQLEEMFPRIAKQLYMLGIGFEAQQIHVLLKQLGAATEKHYMERLLKLLPGLRLTVDDVSKSEFAKVVHFIFQISDFGIRASIINKVARVLVDDQNKKCAVALLSIQAYGENLKLLTQLANEDATVTDVAATVVPDRSKNVRKIINETLSITTMDWNILYNTEKSFLIVDLTDVEALKQLHAGLAEQNTFLIDGKLFSFKMKLGRSLEKPKEKKQVLNITFAAEQASLILELVFMGLYANGFYLNDDARTIVRDKFGVNSLRTYKINADGLVKLLSQQGDDSSMLFLALQNMLFDAKIDLRADLVLYVAKKLIEADLESYAKIITAPYCDEALNQELAGLAKELQTMQFDLPKKPIVLGAKAKLEAAPKLLEVVAPLPVSSPLENEDEAATTSPGVTGGKKNGHRRMESRV